MFQLLSYLTTRNAFHTLLAKRQWMDSPKESNEGVVDEPGASVGNGVDKCGDNCGSNKV